VLRTSLPRSVEAHTAARACATSIQTATDAADQIALGTTRWPSPGGPTRSPTRASSSRARWHRPWRRRRGQDPGRPGEGLRRLKPGTWRRCRPRSTSRPPGSAWPERRADGAAERHQPRGSGRTRLPGHRRSAEAWATGKFDVEVMHVAVASAIRAGGGQGQHRPERRHPRRAGGAEAGLRPEVRHHHRRELLALTDGAAALILVAEEKAKALGLKPLGYVRAYAYAALDPRTSCLQGPAYAAPVALDRAGLTLQDMDLVDMHEAFAAQVLSNCGVRLQEVRAGEAGPLAAPRGGGPGPAQRERRLHRPGHRSAPPAPG